MRHCRLLGAAASISLLIACGSAPTRIYTLYPVAPTAGNAAYAGPPVRIDVVHVPPSMDRTELVSDLAPGELKIDDLDHWSAPLGQVARQALSADLVSRLPRGSVIFPHLAKPQEALGVSVDLLDFRADHSGALLIASWEITAPQQGSEPRRGTVTLSTLQTIAAAGDRATALSLLLAQLADRIVAQL